MFRQIEVSGSTVSITLEGRDYEVPAGIPLAAAILLLGLDRTRNTPVSGAPRLPYCMMGSCFDCLMEIDGIPNQQACRIQVRAGMRVRIQKGAAKLPRSE